jgi:hypothetical protein
MKIFTIENETNYITVHGTIQDAEAVANAERFRNEAGLNKLAADWPAARLVEIWNSLPGAVPVKKFKDRQTAVSRIWKALQSLVQAAPAPDEQPSVAEAPPIPDPVQEASETTEPAAAIPDTPEAVTATHVTPQTPDVAPEEAPAKKKATVRKGADKAAEAVKPPRESSKTAQVVAMLQRKEGATLSEIMTSMGWQKHTVRGCIAGALKNAGYHVESFKPAGGERAYRINQ